VGKSEIAAEIAARCGGEVVGADAFQIYRGLNLLTAKPAAHLLARVPHHLIGEVDLGSSFDVARYAAMAHERLRQLVERKKPAVVCGGTGLYVRALTHGLNELPLRVRPCGRSLKVSRWRSCRSGSSNTTQRQQSRSISEIPAA
jgi:tRNA dimethylallyltransferase